ncbi:hypothetical protein [Blastococcus sp. SYSU DS0617]
MTTEDVAGREADIPLLRPSGRAYLWAVLVNAPFSIGITARNVSEGRTSWVVHVVSIGGTLAVAGVLLLLFFRLAHVRTADGALLKRNLLGVVRRVPHDAIASVLVVPCYRRLRAPDTTLLSFLDADGRALLRLDGLHWDSAQLRSLAYATGTPVTELDGIVTRARLRASHPYAINWAERHTVALYWVTGIASVAIVGAAIVATSLGWCRPDGC